MNRALLTLAFLAALLPSSAPASEKIMHAGELAHALDRVGNTARVLYVAAHPDDENTRLLAYLANRRHVGVAYLSITRGGGGQNLIGTEQGELLDVIRTEELLAARGLDGAEQFFTRMRDFGYSKSPEETLAIWGREEALSDVVRVVRSFQPDVIVTRFDETPPNHGHHIASAILAREAFEAAADPKRFPEQGLAPWRATRILHNVSTWRGPPPPGAMPLDVGHYDPRLGLDLGELAAISRSQHKSQGFGAKGERGELLEHFAFVAGSKPERDPLEGVPTGWARFGPAGAKVDAALGAAAALLDRDQPARAVPALLEVRKALAALPPSSRRDEGIQRLDRVIRGAAGIFVRATAAKPTAVPGAEVEVQVEVLARGGGSLGRNVADAGSGGGDDVTGVRSADGSGHVRSAGGREIEGSRDVGGLDVAAGGGDKVGDADGYGVTLRRIRFADGTTLEPKEALEPGRKLLVDHRLRLAKDAAITVPYWLWAQASDGSYAVEEQRLIGAPRGPAAQLVDVELALAGEEYQIQVPLVHTWTDRVHGERIRPFVVVPPATVTPTREAVILKNGAPGQVALRVRAGQDRLVAKVRLPLPAGWSASPSVQEVELAKAGEERIVHFQVKAKAGAAPLEIRPVVEAFGKRWSYREDEIDYPHIPVQLVLQPASLRLVPVELQLPEGLIGYVEGSGDSIAEDLLHVGARVERIDDETLRAGDLGRFDSIVIGIRAYNMRPAVLAAHQRLMRYVEEGGVVVAQYVTVNRWALIEALRDRWLDTGVGPFPLELGAGRVTDQSAEMIFLQPESPLLHEPNRIVAEDFRGWVQERGLYFGKKWDERYQPLFRVADPGEDPQDGSTLVAHHGKGRYVYTGLAFFRQLRAGVPGAYRLFSNLVTPP